MDVGRGWGLNIAAALRMVGHIVGGPALRRHRRSWGATPQELAATWPGDELLPRPDWSVTHAITIDAAAEEVWPWLAQIGQGRGGLYSFERLENLIGCRIRNTDRILPEHQDLSQVREIRLAPRVALSLAHVEPGRDLVLFASPAESADPGQPVTAGRWSLHLRPAGQGSTRLIERLSFSAGPTWQEKLFSSPALVEPISFVMSQEMMRNIRYLAQRAGRQP
ncbi:hypothetical protein CETAM_09060 [Corynebacterium comes]|uniref:SRPBCC family protein n=2 Tax=Corynebacterium comes TaxID=2675218 RepID=A0A6B8W2B8_9CORY|nr:hypothetical protein CETAM_09060 [Corynebacterium comes]